MPRHSPRSLKARNRHPMNHAQIREYIEAHVTRQPGTKIQYGHPSPRFWSPLSLPPADVAAMRVKNRGLVLYLHIPFCPKTDPPACGFCLFAREDYTGYEAVEVYLSYMLRELEMYAAACEGEELSCIYFGGGTPNMLKPHDYGRLMSAIRARFRIAPGAEITLEGVPELFTEDRLGAMVDAGITRISIGAQQLKSELLRYSGRHHNAGHVLRGVARAHDLGLAVNVDLICGWFDQTTEDLEHDLRLLCAMRPESIVVHPLTLAGPSHFVQEQARLPSSAETCVTFLRGRSYLEEHGYWASSAVDYMLSSPPRGPAEVHYLRSYRDILRHDRLGVGYGANSLFAGGPGRPGRTWRNVDKFEGYYKAIDAGRLPILEGFCFDDVDLVLLYVLKGLEGTPYLRADRYAEDFGGDLARDFAEHWTVLREMGWLTVHDGEYRIVGEGVFYLPVIQRCIANDRNDELRAAQRASRFRVHLPQANTV